MTPLVWLSLYIVGTSIGMLASPLLKNRFPLNLMQGNAAEPRAVRFPRIIFSSLLFGALSACWAGRR